MTQTIEVPIAWFEGLLRAFNEYDKHLQPVENVRNVEDLRIRAAYATLAGYIASIEYTIGADTERQESPDRKRGQDDQPFISPEMKKNLYAQE
jgi:hypothetical protein